MEIISKIVLTGGPCAGKTTIIEKIREYLISKGYNVFIVSETATEVINSGIKPFGDNPLDTLSFQRIIFSQQLNKENSVIEAIKSYKEGNAIVIFDRGILDNKAYMSDEQFNILLDEFNLTELDICNRYDSIIHLNTAALLDEGYTLENNQARSESKEEAINLDKKTYNAWNLHSKLYAVKPEEELNIKVKNVFDIIDLQISKEVKQSKYIVDINDIEFLNDNNIEKQLIEQFYLVTDDLKEIRIRKIKHKDSIKYELSEKYETTSTNIRKQNVKEIDKQTYEKLKSETDNIIYKTRYNFTFNYQHLTLDIFDKDELVILESNNDFLNLPNGIGIVKDVSNDINYRNANLKSGKNKILCYS